MAEVMEIAPLLGAIFVLLTVGSGAAVVLARRAKTAQARITVANLRSRVNAWWGMVAVMVGALALGRGALVCLFGLLSFLALRELITLVPSRRADHRGLIAAFFLAIPVQYALLWCGWYGLFAIFLPVYGFFALSVRVALSGDTERFLHRVAAIQYAVMIGVYCLSHAPALLMLRIPGYEGQEWKLLLFLVGVVQISDVLQYVWGKTLGRHKIVPLLSPSKTVEGFVGGVLSASAMGAALWWLTPFTPLVAFALALEITLAGFCGGLVMSAIKRDAGVKDYGNLLPGHGGILDRVDSLAFASPLMFHTVRWFWSTA
ncbi:MAG: phosphatidate cytidylyltransferase [Deltaproteobacteria bacterium]|nr:phosphatidate cytidylyltransferase [Deltaproteobacteria bacterium]